MCELRRWLFVLCHTLFLVSLARADETSIPESAKAEAAVAQAQSAVANAQAQNALWTSAEGALQKARRALRDKDFATALEQARIAKKHSELGIAQKSYPLFR